VLLISMVPPLNFDGWQWRSKAHPVICGVLPSHQAV
jgi:hypothetical protein